MIGEPKVLFVMPVLRTPEYTKLAYNSFCDSTDLGRHKLVVGMDLDVAEDRVEYEQMGMDVHIHEGWGHIFMALYHFVSNMDEFDYIGLIHNDMVFGKDWLCDVDRFWAESDAETVDGTLLCTNLNTIYDPHIHSIGEFDYDDFLSRVSDNPYRGDYYYDHLSFMPWIIPKRLLATSLDWLTCGDTGVIDKYWNQHQFKVRCLYNSYVHHFVNVSVRLHRDDFYRNQHTRYWWQSLADDSRWRFIAKYLIDNTCWSTDANLTQIYALGHG